MTNTVLQCMGYKRTDVLLNASRGESFFLPFLECPYFPWTFVAVLISGDGGRQWGLEI